LRRTIYTQDHEAYRHALRAFIQAEVVPHYDKWLADGMVPRDLYRKVGAFGAFGITVSEEYGGSGLASHKYLAVQAEEVARAGVSLGTSAHVLLCLPYLEMLGTSEQKRRFLPRFVTGEEMWSLAMTEPDAGSDLAAIRTSARRSADGSYYTLDGAKTFISGGVHANRIIVCARTSAPREDDRRFGLSLFAVDTSLPGYEVGRKLDKLGLRVEDTAELSFSGVRVPAEDLLGAENEGFRYLGHNLASERWGIAHGAYAQAAAAVRFAQQYVEERQVFGKPVAHFQNTKFELAACKAEVDAAEAVSDRALEALDAGELTAANAASTKLFCTEVAHRVIDRCLQLHGGYGFINEFPIARLYADNRVNRIYGGTSEVMKMIIAKDMGL
jgi:acyl-CoA dehydrogenase